jgi:hypothetical protein
MYIPEKSFMSSSKQKMKESEQSSSRGEARSRVHSSCREDGGIETAQERTGCPRGLNPSCPFALTCKSEGQVCTAKTRRSVAF